MTRVFTASLMLALLGACQAPESEVVTRTSGPAPIRANSKPGRSVAPSEVASNAACRERIQKLRAVPGLSGAPKLELNRVQILGRAKATPVLFVSEPAFEADVPPEVAYIRGLLERDPSARTLASVYPMIYKRPELARAVLLRQGYLYTDAPTLAFALLQKVELQHLFQEAELSIERGSERLVAVRQGDHYVYRSGPDAGERAKILLFDRVWVGTTAPEDSLHVDLEALGEGLGFWRARLVHATKQQLVLELAYGADWVPSLLTRQAARLELDCEVLEGDQKRRVYAARSLEHRHQFVLRRQQQAIHDMVKEALPFDEPRTEEGQQDGNLRPAWHSAYRRGESFYEFNGDRYPVFDGDGRPRVPQVCIDFITDTLERASGRWWQPRGGDRLRAQGKLAFDAFQIDNQRSVERFTEFAWQEPEKFDVYLLEEHERVELRQGDRFFSELAEHAARYRPGDIVNILGLKSDEKYHYHSLFVYKSDPVTGMPIWLASNAGSPRLRSWYGEMLNAPRRSLKSRIRPRLEWLESMLGGARPLASEPVLASDGSG